MVERTELADYLNSYLDCQAFSDLGPNGLQVEGKARIARVVTAVSAGVELFEKAIEKKADAILVHHGIIWDFERPVYRGGYKKRVKLLLENDLNLFACHLPLDAHPQVGNNAVMARLLGVSDLEPFGEYHGKFVGYKGKLAAQPVQELIALMQKEINPDLLHFAYGPQEIRTIGIISGGAQKNVNQAVAEGLDLFLTGEVSEHILNYVKEEGIHFVAAGHYATERFGVLALGSHLAERFDIEVEFVDIPNPV